MKLYCRKKVLVKALTIFSCIFSCFSLSAQEIITSIDSIQKACMIPELGYSIVSADSIFELKVAGVQRMGTNYLASQNDKFRIGSNTKAVTGFIAALLVKQSKINWNTRFFDLFPELKDQSHKAYHHLTLLNLLSFRTKLIPYTYTYEKPEQSQFSGTEDEQRYQFAKWFFAQEPVAKKDSVCFSNLGYVAAALMLEKVSGKSYAQLVNELGNELGITFGFGAPNSSDTLQPWGHNSELKPEQPGDNYKLSWLEAAGNINMSLPDYAVFIQHQLKGLQGQSQLLSKEEFYFLHFGLKIFSVGWFNDTTSDGQSFSYNIGNPGTFLTQVYIFDQKNRAIILFTNAQTTRCSEGLDAVFELLYAHYVNQPEDDAGGGK
jgi:CubicO group peptidase (beta-lactamase class C family)